MSTEKGADISEETKGTTANREISSLSEENIIVRENEALLILGRVIHSLEYCGTDASLSYFQVDIDSYLSELYREEARFFFGLISLGDSLPYKCFGADSEVTSVLLEIMEELTEKRRHYEIAVRGNIFKLITLMSREGLLLLPDDEGNKTKERLIPLLLYIEEHFRDKMSLDELSHMFGFNKYNLCKLFSRTMGSTFVEYLNLRRISHAERLISMTDMTIADIAFDAGFNSVQYFNRTFLALRGVSPRIFRAMCMKNE